MYLPDVNFWLALAFQSHEFHPSAKQWAQHAGAHSALMCRVTQMSFLRLASNPKVMPGYAVSLRDAWGCYDQIFVDERVAFAEEPPGLQNSWRALTQQNRFSTNVWTDAYLAAFAIAADLELITFDKGFRQFKGLRHTILS